MTSSLSSSQNKLKCKLKNDQLKELCEKRNIQGYKYKKKDDLIQLLQKYHTENRTSSSYIDFTNEEKKELHIIDG